VTPLETAIQAIVDLLIRREFQAIEKLSDGRRLSAAELEAAVSSYGCTLCAPPKGWIAAIDIVPIDGRDPAKFFAAVPLWTEEEGRSDLTLELRLTESAPGAYETEVLDLHVL
jgi:hypothetical protein